MSHRFRGVAVIPLLAASALGCGRDMPRTSPTATADLAQPRFAVAAAKDPVMGRLSGYAQVISAAAQDSAVRVAIAAALRAAPGGLPELDLQDCRTNGVVIRMIAEAARRGGPEPSTLCGVFEQETGLVLYMDPDRLAHWDVGTVPVVTALSDPTAPLPATFEGYSNPDRTVVLPGDGRSSEPTLVVLPIVHSARLARGKRPELPLSALPASPMRGASK